MGKLFRMLHLSSTEMKQLLNRKIRWGGMLRKPLLRKGFPILTSPMGMMAIGISLLLLHCATSHAQNKDPDSSGAVHFSFNGYVKDLNSFLLPVKNMPFQYSNLVHNRLNFKWQSTHFNAAAEMRNRLLWNSSPGPAYYGKLERGWIEYKSTLWSIKAGRQRINWGMNNAWNPNDVFNAYNMFDFDYEERAGVDGLRIHYQKNETSAVELAATKDAAGKTINGAIKYNFNRSNYDWQLIAGLNQKRITLGIGWQGSIGETGFKGEAQYFVSSKNGRQILNASMEIDHITKNGWYLNAAALFNQQGIASVPSDWSLLSFQNKPDNLMPTRWNIMSGASKEITPIVNGRIGLLYAPFTNLVVFYPSMSFNVITNLDLDIFLQSLFGTTNGKFSAIGHSIFVRGKYSF